MKDSQNSQRILWIENAGFFAILLELKIHVIGHTDNMPIQNVHRPA